MTERAAVALHSTTENQGILTEFTVIVNRFRALNLQFDCDIFSNGVNITSPDNLSLRLKLILIGLPFWFTRLGIVIPTVPLSLRFCSACSKRSFTLARNWLKGCLALEGGYRRNISCSHRTEPCIPSSNCVLNLESTNHSFVCKLLKICAVTHCWTIFANILTIVPLIWLLITDVSPLYTYLQYAPIILSSGTYYSKLITVRLLAFLYSTTNYVMSPKARV